MENITIFVEFVVSCMEKKEGNTMVQEDIEDS